MNAIVKEGEGEGLVMKKVGMPRVRDDECLVKVSKVGICGTDVHIYRWDGWAAKNVEVPLVIGHEFVGVVEEVGRMVKYFTVGDKVVGEGHLVCGGCRHCLVGEKHLCGFTRGVGVHRDGGFAEYVSMPEVNLWRAEGYLEDEVLACFDPLGNAVHAAMSFDLLGKNVLITGAGPIGCFAVGVARMMGARNIVVVDVNGYRLGIAKRMGATAVVEEGKEPTLRQVMKYLEIREGFDVGLEMSGAGKALKLQVEQAGMGGGIAILGIINDKVRVDWQQVVFKGLVMKGIYGRKVFETWYQVSALLRAGLDIKPVITHRLHYKDYDKGFKLMMAGKCGKVILDWERDKQVPYYSVYRKNNLLKK